MNKKSVSSKTWSLFALSLALMTEPVSTPHSIAAFDDVEHVEIDEHRLPTLNIQSPALFDWSDDERSYYAGTMRLSVRGEFRTT